MNNQTALKALNQKVASLPSLDQLSRPHKGWLKAVREALGMTSKQFAKRLGVSAPRITALEKAELDDSVTLGSLRRGAEALDCALVYAFVPKDSFDEIIHARARKVASNLINKVDNTMSLEAQSLSKHKNNNEISKLAEDLYRNNNKIIWDDVK